jgi:methionyl-tRNA formyltransferase
VFAALAAGDKKTGVSIMRMTEEIDMGPILGQAKTIIRSDTRETLTRRLGILGGKLIVKTLKNIENGQINEVKQPQKSPTFYTHRLTKDSGRIDWRFRPGETSPERSRRIERFIRAAFPWPGAQTRAKFEIRNSKFEIKELKILKAHLESKPQQPLDCHAPPAGGARNDFCLIIDEVQLPGKNPVSWKQFLAGHPEAEFE